MVLEMQSVPEHSDPHWVLGWAADWAESASDERQFFKRGGEHETKLPFTSGHSVSTEDHEDLFRPWQRRHHAFGNEDEIKGLPGSRAWILLFHVVSRSWTFPAECLGMLYVAALFWALGTPSAMQCEHAWYVWLAVTSSIQHSLTSSKCTLRGLMRFVCECTCFLIIVLPLCAIGLYNGRARNASGGLQRKLCLCPSYV